jgi:hypothetical protein
MMNAGWWCNNHLEKYEFVNGKDDIPYMKWKIIQSCLKPPTRLDIVGMMSNNFDNCGILEEFWDLADSHT